MDVLGPIIGETAARIVILAAVLLLIAALTLLLVGLALRIFRGRSFGLRGSRNRAPRLSVPDVLPVDSRRKLILVRRDTVEHLLLIGGATDLVIEQAIQRNVQPAQRGRPPAQGAREGAAPQNGPPAPAPTGAPPAGRPGPRPSPVNPAARPGTPPAQRPPSRPTPVPLRPVNTPGEPATTSSASVVPLGIAAPPRPSRMQPPPAAPIVGAGTALTAPARPTPAAGNSDTPPTSLARTDGAATDAAPIVTVTPDDAVLPAETARTIEAEMAALVPPAAERAEDQVKPADAAPTPVAEEPMVPTESDAEARERAERLSSRESDMAELLGEIFGKK